METISSKLGSQGDSSKEIRPDYIERPAIGSKGLLLGSAGHMFFRFEGKDYFIASHDLDLKILSTDACLREAREIGNEHFKKRFPSVLDFLEDVVGEARFDEPVVLAAGMIGCLHPQDPYQIYIQILENQIAETHVYQIWHTHLEVEIIDKDAAFFHIEGQKYNKYWDGYLSYTSESMEPATKSA